MPSLTNLILALAALNLVAFGLFGFDKAFARGNRRRIPEKTLILAAALAASAGALLGMVIFNHKTSKPLFRYGVPTLALVHAGVGYWLSLG